ELRVDVDVARGEQLVDARQHAWYVPVDVQQTAAARMFGQGHLGEIHRRQSGAVVAVAHQLTRHLDADVVLRLQRAAADVRGEDRIVHAYQRRHEWLVVALRLDREYVHGGASQMSVAQGRSERIDVDHAAARGVDQHRAPAHCCDLPRAEHQLGGWRLRYVQGHHVGAPQQV